LYICSTFILAPQNEHTYHVDTKTLTKYKCILASFMSFIHNRAAGSEYPRDDVHAIEVLAAVTPNHDVLSYLNMKMFGTTDPTGDANQISARANSLAMDKKAILYFMPNRDVWSVTRTEGNPTQSALVNALIKRVKKKEARKQGVDSQTQRPMLVMNLLLCITFRIKKISAGRRSKGAHAVFWKGYGISAMTNFQFHLIARVDNSTQLVLEHIQVHDSFPSALKTRLNWSKKDDDECDAPWQIILGSLNPTMYCVVLCSLALWLELNLILNPTAMTLPYFCINDNIRVPVGGLKSKAMIQAALTIRSGAKNSTARATVKEE
jgi:hypothetical protein